MFTVLCLVLSDTSLGWGQSMSMSIPMLNLLWPFLLLLPSPVLWSVIKATCSVNTFPKDEHWVTIFVWYILGTAEYAKMSTASLALSLPLTFDLQNLQRKLWWCSFLIVTKLLLLSHCFDLHFSLNVSLYIFYFIFLNQRVWCFFSACEVIFSDEGHFIVWCGGIANASRDCP